MICTQKICWNFFKVQLSIRKTQILLWALLWALSSSHFAVALVVPSTVLYPFSVLFCFVLILNFAFRKLLRQFPRIQSSFFSKLLDPVFDNPACVVTVLFSQNIFSILSLISILETFLFENKNNLLYSKNLFVFINDFRLFSSPISRFSFPSSYRRQLLLILFLRNFQISLLVFKAFFVVFFSAFFFAFH